MGKGRRKQALEKLQREQELRRAKRRGQRDANTHSLGLSEEDKCDRRVTMPVPHYVLATTKDDGDIHVFRTESFKDRNAIVAFSSEDNAVRFREAETLQDCRIKEYEVLHLENDELLDLLRTGYHQGCDTVVLDATTQNTSVEFTADVAEMILAIANAPDVAGEVRARFSLSLF